MSSSESPLVERDPKLPVLIMHSTFMRRGRRGDG